MWLLSEALERGSTTILNDVEPTKAWSRWFVGWPAGGLNGSELSVLSRRVQVAPPSVERRKPTPWLPTSPSPVAAKTTDWFGSLFRGKTAIEPMLMAKLGPKSVSGTQV